jgi:hypothetical protein
MEVVLSGGNYGGMKIDFKEDQIIHTIKDENFNTETYKIKLDSVPLEADLINSYCDTDAFTLSVKKQKQKIIWETIKLERERRKFSGVKVGNNWFHTDPDSRTQQLGLLTASAANAIPPGYMWKTLTPGGGLFDPVYVEMNTELAQNIFFHTMLHDGVFHAAGEAHRAAMINCEDPDTYNYKINWPLSFEDVEAEFKRNNPEM